MLGDDLLLLLPELPGSGLRVRGGGLLVGQRLLELRLARLSELLLADLALRHLLVGLVRAGGEVELLGRGRFGRRARGRDRRGLARLLGRHRGDRLGDGLRLVRRRIGGRLDGLGLAVLTGADQARDLTLDLGGLPGLLVVVGLLERLGRLRLDRGLDGGDERLLVERPGLLGVHRVDLGRLGLPGEVVGGGERGVLGLLGLRRGGRVGTLRPSGGLYRVRDLGERLVGRRTDAGRGDGRGEQLVVADGGAGAVVGPVVAAGAGRLRAGAAPFRPTALAGFAALAAGLTFGTGLGGGTGFLAGTASGPNPVRTTASADAGGFCAAPSRSTGTPAAFAAFSPLSTVSTAGSSWRTSRRAASMLLTASAPGDRIRPASSALTAAFPAERCNASNPAAARNGGRRPVAGHRQRASSRRVAALSGVSRAPPIHRASPVGVRRGTARHATCRAHRPARKGSARNRACARSAELQRVSGGEYPHNCGACEHTRSTAPIERAFSLE